MIYPVSKNMYTVVDFCLTTQPSYIFIDFPEKDHISSGTNSEAPMETQFVWLLEVAADWLVVEVLSGLVHAMLFKRIVMLSKKRWTS